MGVKGLLPCLQSITRNVSLENYRGLTAAVDAMCWLHKGVLTGDVRALAKYQQQQQGSHHHRHQNHHQQEQKKWRQQQGGRGVGEGRTSSTARAKMDDEIAMTTNMTIHHEGEDFNIPKSQFCREEDNDNDENHPSSSRHSSSCFVKKRLDFDQFATSGEVKKTRYSEKLGNTDNSNQMIQQNMSLQEKCNGNHSADAKMAMIKCADYVIRHAEQVRQTYGIELILVIDGAPLPSKKMIDEKRRLEREHSFQKGLQADKRGDSREARKQFTRACSISHEIRHELIFQCKLKGIAFIVAPYESDAQLAKLAHDGIADVIISEDSDLLAYGCPRVLFKIDFRSGRGDEIQIMRDLASNSSPSFRHWNHDMFVYMCILSGCDYCEGIPGIGVQSAHKIVRIHRKPSKIFKALSSSGKLPAGYENAFWIAYNTFRHQRIYCLQKGVIEPLFPILQQEEHQRQGDEHGGIDVWPFLGRWIEPNIGRGIADGTLHPIKHIPWTQLETVSRVNDHKSNSSSLQWCHSVDEEQYNKRDRASTLDIPVAAATTAKANMSNLASALSHKVTDEKNKRVSSSRQSLFAFFKTNDDGSNNNSVDIKKPQRTKMHPQYLRPPLHEISLNRNEDSLDICISNGKEQSIPTHFHDYSSKLVSASFQPLSRYTSLSLSRVHKEKRKGASKAIKKLKKSLSLKKVLEMENARYIHQKNNNKEHLEEEGMPREGQQEEHDSLRRLPAESSASCLLSYSNTVATRTSEKPCERLVDDQLYYDKDPWIMGSTPPPETEDGDFKGSETHFDYFNPWLVSHCTLSDDSTLERKFTDDSTIPLNNIGGSLLAGEAGGRGVLNAPAIASNQDEHYEPSIMTAFPNYHSQQSNKQDWSQSNLLSLPSQEVYGNLQPSTAQNMKLKPTDLFLFNDTASSFAEEKSLYEAHDYLFPYDENNCLFPYDENNYSMATTDPT